VGAQVKVDGVDFGDGSTEVRWNAIDGPLLGHGSAERFSVAVTIPQAEPGVYAIVGLARRTDGSVGVKAVTPFQISAGAGAADPGGPGGSAPVAVAPHPSSTSDPPSGPAVAAFAAAGLALLIAGGLGGAYLAGRRRRYAEVER
jgi:hypothetical protein